MASAGSHATTPPPPNHVTSPPPKRTHEEIYKASLSHNFLTSNWRTESPVMTKELWSLLTSANALVESVYSSAFLNLTLKKAFGANAKECARIIMDFYDDGLFDAGELPMSTRLYLLETVPDEVILFVSSHVPGHGDSPIAHIVILMDVANKSFDILEGIKRVVDLHGPLSKEQWEDLHEAGSKYPGRCPQNVRDYLLAKSGRDTDRGPCNPMRDGYKCLGCNSSDIGCRMLTCHCLAYDSDEEDWYTESCSFCDSSIDRREDAKRAPLPEGGWLGCYCSWECVAKCTDYTSPESFPLLMKFSEMSHDEIESCRMERSDSE